MQYACDLYTLLCVIFAILESSKETVKSYE